MSRNFGKKKAEAVDPTRIPKNIDINSLFLAPSIPEEVRAIVPILHESLDNLTEILNKVVEYYINGVYDDQEFLYFQKSLGQNNNANFSIIFSGLYSILRASISKKCKISTINKDLTRMNFPVNAIESICSSILTANSSITMMKTVTTSTTPTNNTIKFPSLQKLRWRIDVVISSGSLSRVMRPSILMQMILSDGSIKTFEISHEQFNQLRYGVAKVLLDMQKLERHPIMKLVTEMSIKNEEEISK